uniref:Conjugal transfer protein TraN n=1 Tax=Rhabditophanes sp. KR3021 TaxID=114890 RepID=A0AC35TIA9_9BILA
MRNSIFYILACTSLMLVQTLFACMPIGVTNGVCDCQSTPACSQCPAQQQSAQGFAYHYDAPRPVVQAAAHPTLINSHSSPIIPPPPKDPFTSEPYNSLETNFPGMSELTNLDATNDPYLMPAKNTPEFEMANNNLALSIRQIDEKDKLAHEQEVGSIIESSFDENVANQTEDSFLGTGIGYPAGEIKKGMGNGLSFTVEQASSNGLFEATTKATFLPTLSPIPEDSKSSVYKIKHESLKTTSFPYNSFPITSEATMQFTSLPNQICKGETISTSRERTVSAATVKCNIIGCTALNLKTINDTTIEVVYLQSLTTTLSLEGYTCLRGKLPKKSCKVIYKW